MVDSVEMLASDMRVAIKSDDRVRLLSRFPAPAAAAAAAVDATVTPGVMAPYMSAQSSVDPASNDASLSTEPGVSRSSSPLERWENPRKLSRVGRAGGSPSSRRADDGPALPSIGSDSAGGSADAAAACSSAARRLSLSAACCLYAAIRTWRSIGSSSSQLRSTTIVFLPPLLLVVMRLYASS